MKPGQAFLIECPGAIHYHLPKGSPHWELKFISLNSACGGILKHIISEYGNVFSLPPSCKAIEYWDYLYDLSVKGEMDNFFNASIYSYSFMMHLHDSLRSIPGLRRSNMRLQNCLDVIHANYQKNISLKQLSEVCNLSPSYLTKIFRDNFNATPIQYLINYRIEQACQLLLQNNLRIEDIALQTGFSSANYFSRTFKAVVGISPKDYRKEERIETLHQKETQQLIVRYEMLE